MANSRDELQVFDNESEIVLGMLNAVEKNSTVTQRTVAKELGIALGLANSYLKRCVKKGWIKVQQVPANRYAYYLTPKGFAEKGRLTGEYLTQGFHFFRLARTQCAEIYRACGFRGWNNVVLHGLTDLAEVAVLCADDSPVNIAAIIDPDTYRKEFAGIPVVTAYEQVGSVDAIIITDLGDPQASFDSLKQKFPRDRILAPPILGIVDERVEGPRE